VVETNPDYEAGPAMYDLATAPATAMYDLAAGSTAAPMYDSAATTAAMYDLASRPTSPMYDSAAPTAAYDLSSAAPTAAVVYDSAAPTEDNTTADDTVVLYASAGRGPPLPPPRHTRSGSSVRSYDAEPLYDPATLPPR
jgi:hypothetical protein